MSKPQHAAFMKAVMAQIRADNHVSLFEWALYSLLRHHLNPAYKPARANAQLETLATSCRTILLALALATHDATDSAAAAFDRSWQQLSLPAAGLSSDALDNLAGLDNAVRALATLQPLAKPRFLKACCAAMEQNGQYAPESVELLRSIADTLDAPIPPLLIAVATP